MCHYVCVLSDSLIAKYNLSGMCVQVAPYVASSSNTLMWEAYDKVFYSGVGGSWGLPLQAYVM